jgi:ribonuclease HII
MKIVSQPNIDVLKVLPHYGVDEAGRGCLNGPVVVAAVKLKEECPKDLFFDSKSLSEEARERAYDNVIEYAEDIVIVEVSPKQVDDLNVLNATLWGMSEVWLRSKRLTNRVVVDGNKTPNMMGESANYTAVVKGDALLPSISAASIIAKVHRDRYMMELAKEYPFMGYEKHKGYATKEHLKKMAEHGINKTYRESCKPVHPYLGLQGSLF